MSLLLRKAGIFLVGNIVLAMLARFLMSYFNISGGYAEGYVFTLAQIKGGMLSYLKMINSNYGLVFIITMAIAIFRLGSSYLRKNFSDNVLFWEAIFLFWFIVFIFLQSPWSFIMGRYLPPALIGLCFVMGVEASKILSFMSKQLKSRNTVYKIGLILLCVGLLLRALIPSYREIVSLQRRAVAAETVNAEAVAFLAKNTPENGRIFYNFSDGSVELLYEMGVHFSIIYNRPDIETSYLFLQGESNFRKGDIVVSWLPSYARYPWKDILGHFKYLKEIKDIGGQWTISEFENNETTPPLVLNGAWPDSQKKKEMMVFSDGKGTKAILMDDSLAKKGGISFLWQPPKSEDSKKISLISQGDIPLVWVENKRMFFEIYNNSLKKGESAIVNEDFSNKKQYSIILNWGPQGMTFSLNNVYKFHPYYRGLNSSNDLVLGPLKRVDFQEDSGVIYDFKISAE